MKIKIAGAVATVTVAGSDGIPVQIPQAIVAQAQLGLIQPGPDGTVTVPGSDGKPIKIPQAALAAAPSALSNIAGGNTYTFKLNSYSKTFS